jgi:hypothetical protein
MGYEEASQEREGALLPIHLTACLKDGHYVIRQGTSIIQTIEDTAVQVACVFVSFRNSTLWHALCQEPKQAWLIVVRHTQHPRRKSPHAPGGEGL